MRDLAKTEVMKSAALAALLAGLVCWPRLELWPKRSYPVWYLEAVLLLGGFVLWAFVFAWHAKYNGRAVLTFKLPTRACVLVTVTAMVMAACLHGFVDPLFRANTPEDYPTDLRQWIALTLFSLALNQLLLVFAPFDWSLRLFQRRWVAMLFTVVFGALVLVVKTRSSAAELAPSAFWLLMIVRVMNSFLSVWFYARYGAVLVWWWGFLLQVRHLVNLAVGSD